MRQGGDPGRGAELYGDQATHNSQTHGNNPDHNPEDQAITGQVPLNEHLEKEIEDKNKYKLPGQFLKLKKYCGFNSKKRHNVAWNS